MTKKSATVVRRRTSSVTTSRAFLSAAAPAISAASSDGVMRAALSLGGTAAIETPRADDLRHRGGHEPLEAEPGGGAAAHLGAADGRRGHVEHADALRSEAQCRRLLEARWRRAAARDDGEARQLE